MLMRPVEELEEILQKLGFQETGKKTGKHKEWIDPSGEPFSVPTVREVPEAVFVCCVEVATRLYKTEQERVHQKLYNLTHKDSAALKLVDPKKD
ncbi:MAG TPA: hypothetical protein VHW09_27250 [Bryobacteraceae bacterium]|jgi:hypothetical protein|nr:hypothetical protein [Bryobacteraceae bacterium]